jgi:ketosteroid isomerase-like protein
MDADAIAREVIGEYLAAMEGGDREAALALYAEDVLAAMLHEAAARLLA